MMRKIILLVSFLASFASADWLYEGTYECINSFYTVPTTKLLYYRLSHNNQLVQATSSGQVSRFLSGYDYNSTSNQCLPTPFNNALKIENNDYNYAMALTGLVCGLLIASSTIVVLKSATS